MFRVVHCSVFTLCMSTLDICVCVCAKASERDISISSISRATNGFCDNRKNIIFCACRLACAAVACVVNDVCLLKILFGVFAGCVCICEVYCCHRLNIFVPLPPRSAPIDIGCAPFHKICIPNSVIGLYIHTFTLRTHNLAHLLMNRISQRNRFE